MTTDWKPELIARYRELAKGPAPMPSIDEDIQELEDIVRRANMAHLVEQYDEAKRLIAKAKEIIKRIDPDLVPPTQQ